MKLEQDIDILEIGCGSGGNFELLSRFGNLYAIEMDDVAIENARKRQNAAIMKGSVPDRIPFGDKPFDLIAFLDVLEHIEDDLAALKMIRNRLKNNGSVLLTVPAYQFLWSKLDEVNLHKRRYIKSELIKLFNNAGFSVIYATYFNTILFPSILLTRIINQTMGDKEMVDGITITGKINTVLTRIFSFERFFIPRFSLPFGVSLLIIARKKQDKKI